MKAVGFDNDKYLKIQSEHILERISHFGQQAVSGDGREALR